jgi:coiled-coil domain-containing protein 12
MGDRKARLAALAAKAGRTKAIPTDAASDHAEDEEAPTPSENKPISFRNYAPHDNTLDESTEGGDRDESSPSKRPRLEETTKPTTSALDQALQQAKQELGTKPTTTSTPDVTTMAPKKLNWDLKRDSRDKLAKLERRTQKAIVEMLKERLEHEAAEQANSEDDSDLD